MARTVPASQSHSPLLSYVTLVGLLCFVFWLVSAVRLATVPSGSMEPTLQPGDTLVMRIDAYRHTLPLRGDVVIFHDKTHDGELLVKRVVGLPGEDLYIQGGVVWINGQLLVEKYLKQPYLSSETHNVLLGKDEFFVMGDNRQRSSDSRDFGPIRPNQLVGRAAAIIWPMHRRTRLATYEGRPRQLQQKEKADPAPGN